MGARDAGWVQIFSENSQETYDNILQAFRIAEHPHVQLPVMVMLDGFILSHTLEVLNVLSDPEAAAFVGEYRPAKSLLDVKNPTTVGSLVLPDFYFECRWQQVEAMRRAFSVVESVGVEFGKVSDRTYGLLAPYKLEDSEVALVGLGSTMGTAKVAVDNLRAQGVNAGLLSIRCYRPFPAAQIREALKRVGAIAILDRSISYGLEGGPLFNEVRSAMFGVSNYMTNYIYGLGGRDVNPDELGAAIRQTLDAARGKVSMPVMNAIGLRETAGKLMCL
jgi:pyruvate ferredoxin oxidoreductase alpha subunit